MALLLHISESARAVADKERLFIEIMDEVDNVHAHLDGVSCADFLRRFGDAKVGLFFFVKCYIENTFFPRKSR